MGLAADAASAQHVSGFCYLTLTQHRTGLLLAKVLMRQQPARFSIEFIHSVLGTRVSDQYELRSDGANWRAHLIEEVFDGQGYGLPYAALEPGERFERFGEGWRLTLDRVVEPLVQLPLPEQKIELVLPDGRLRLGALSETSVRITLEGCHPY